MDGPRACGCSIFAGGFTAGLLESGFDVVAQWEEIQAGAKTFELNFPSIEHPTDKASWNAEKMKGVELFYGNPPCAPWSVVGSGLGLADPRMEMTKNVMEAGLVVEPEFFILESVCRAWSPNGGRAYYTDWARRWMAQGYGVTIVLTNALLHGAPQSRERFHFIAHRMQLGLEAPQLLPTDIRTVRDSIYDLKSKLGELPNHDSRPVSAGGLTVMNELAQGEGWYDARERVLARGEDAPKARFLSYRLAWDTPCGTVVDINSLVHPDEPRFLTVREGARLCGYPDWFEFYRNPKRQLAEASEVTQAVIPYVGQFWGKTVMRALDVARPLEPDQLRELRVVDWRPLGKPFFPSRFNATLAQFQRDGV